jgi:hypothetical protein
MGEREREVRAQTLAAQVSGPTMASAMKVITIDGTRSSTPARSSHISDHCAVARA